MKHNDSLIVTRKFGVFCLTIFVAILFAGLYGILHDQVTYTISPEYFTKFKYRQFGIEPLWFGGHREAVAVIGFLATWWTGIFIGLGLGLTALIYNDHKQMIKAVFKTIGIVLVIAVLFGIIGYFYGKSVLVTKDVNWWFPADLVDKPSFIIVGSIHNTSYLGGFTGLIAGIFYLIWRKRKLNTDTPHDIIIKRDPILRVQEDRNIVLPEIFKSFYMSYTTSMPANLVGTDVFNNLNDLNDDALELFKEDGVNNFLSDKDFVFMMHQGYMFWYFRADGHPDPIVYSYYEGKSKPEDKGLLSKFIEKY